jgi:hypothetical protein
MYHILFMKNQLGVSNVEYDSNSNDKGKTVASGNQENVE